MALVHSTSLPSLPCRVRAFHLRKQHTVCSFWLGGSDSLSFPPDPQLVLTTPFFKNWKCTEGPRGFSDKSCGSCSSEQKSPGCMNEDQKVLDFNFYSQKKSDHRVFICPKQTKLITLASRMDAAPDQTHHKPWFICHSFPSLPPLPPALCMLFKQIHKALRFAQIFGSGSLAHISMSVCTASVENSWPVTQNKTTSNPSLKTWTVALSCFPLKPPTCGKERGERKRERFSAVWPLNVITSYNKSSFHEGCSQTCS